jgi:hypothetical protein
LGPGVLRFLCHLAAVYAIAELVVPLFGGWVCARLMPLAAPGRRIECVYSHLFAFSLIPALSVALVNARFRHAAAQYVWSVPLAVLAYKVAIFSNDASLLYPSSGIAQGFHHYLGGNFSIPAYASREELRQLYAYGPPDEMIRGFDQERYTVPFYVGVGYALSSLVSIRWKRSLPEVLDSIERWHEQTRLPKDEPIE